MASSTSATAPESVVAALLSVAVADAAIPDAVDATLDAADAAIRVAIVIVEEVDGVTSDAGCMTERLPMSIGAIARLDAETASGGGVSGRSTVEGECGGGGINKRGGLLAGRLRTGGLLKALDPRDDPPKEVVEGKKTGTCGGGGGAIVNVSAGGVVTAVG